VIQGGDPDGTGMGGPGYKFDDEPVTMGYARGTVAMANSGPNTNGSQFFICLDDLASLPPKYTIFGMVTSGLATVDAIAKGATGPGDRPLEPVKMTTVTIA
jgi:cyclophilin family peptidyl-prolyl cis-trans isomerase